MMTDMEVRQWVLDHVFRERSVTSYDADTICKLAEVYVQYVLNGPPEP